MARHRAAPVSVSTTGLLSRASAVANSVPLAATLSTLPASNLFYLFIYLFYNIIVLICYFYFSVNAIPWLK
jgi:hypothetical protein